MWTCCRYTRQEIERRRKTECGGAREWERKENGILTCTRGSTTVTIWSCSLKNFDRVDREQHVSNSSDHWRYIMSANCLAILRKTLKGTSFQIIWLIFRPFVREYRKVCTSVSLEVSIRFLLTSRFSSLVQHLCPDKTAQHKTTKHCTTQHNTHTHTRTWTYTYTYTYIDIHMYILIHMYLNTIKNFYIHIHIYIYK